MWAPPLRSSVVASALASMALACAPTLQQRAAPYPAHGQSFQQLQHDSVECEGWAQSNAGSGGESVAGGALAGAALGAALGAAAGAFFGAADTGAALGAALGGTQGASGGAAAYDIRLSAAYQNCMAARGYAIGGYVPPSPDRTTATSSDPPRRIGVEQRLEQLQNLYRDGLISKRELGERRAWILNEL